MCPDESKAQSNKAVSHLQICFISPYPPRFGGIATYSHELVEAIKKRGHTVYVICNPDLDAGGHIGQENVIACPSRAVEPAKNPHRRDVSFGVQHPRVQGVFVYEPEFATH